MRKSLVILVVLSLSSFLMGCNPCKDVRGAHLSITYNGIYFHNLKMKTNEYNPKGYYEITDDTLFEPLKYGFHLNMSYEYEHLPQAYNRHFTSGFSLFSEAVACSPATYYTIKDKVTSIKIYTINDFDTKNQAGGDVTKLFARYAGGGNYYPIGEKDSGLVELLNGGYFQMGSQICLRAVPTKGNENVQFKVEVELESGTKIIEDTPQVKISVN